MVQDNSTKPSLWQIIKSVLGAMFGVQSSAVRYRDFTRGNPWIYVVVGIVFVSVFVLAVYAVVRIVIHQAGM